LWVFSQIFYLATNYGDSIPIDVDSNGDVVAEVERREAKRPTAIQMGAYKPSSTAISVGKPPKCQIKLPSAVWKHYGFLPPDEGRNLFCKCKKCGQTYSGDSKY